MHKILFVCLGNICRSPMAEGIFRHLVTEAALNDQFFIDSAGTGAWHAGEPPDLRAQSCMRGHAIEICHQRARQFREEDFEEFDHILVMDQHNYEAVMERSYDLAHGAKVKKLLAFHGDPNFENVPDPYFGGDQGFEHVYEMLTLACRNFLKSLRVPGEP